ncbi:hypothetical protein GcM1_002002 [Golovinomyces cichoracearum]|uniref:Uncharacterized protein n=1 Tax=Golovinomyces cichoracearum TaxID=62708 RepID=A0A420JCU7_9PEZI|nr:hypothetical protein GcM1_002002 [Golovinomyces cichoracearum]
MAQRLLWIAHTAPTTRRCRISRLRLFLTLARSSLSFKA